MSMPETPGSNRKRTIHIFHKFIVYYLLFVIELWKYYKLEISFKTANCLKRTKLNKREAGAWPTFVTNNNLITGDKLFVFADYEIGLKLFPL